MAQPIELVPLTCIKCSTPIPAQPDEVAWVCAQCGQGMLLDEKKGLEPLQVNFAAGPANISHGKPYWVVQAQVTIQQRQTYRGNQEREAVNLWSQPRLFIIPAFNCPLEQLLDLGQMFLHNPPAIQAGPPIPFEPVVLALEDVASAVDFIIMAVEAGRKDQLQKVDFTANLSAPALWVLPS